jgi:ABC-2 type transport system ATP-binding protein
VISHGMLRGSGTLEEVLGSPEGPVTRVRSADGDRLAVLLRDRGIAAEPDGSGGLVARGVPPEAVGAVAAEHQVVLAELVAVSRSLEDAFFALTEGER